VPRDLAPVLAQLAARPIPMGAFGAPGEGKTTIAAQLFAFSPCTSIFINTQHEAIFDRMRGVWRANSFGDVWRSLKTWQARTPPKIEWRPSEPEQVDVSRGLNALWAWKRTTNDRRLVRLFVDEAHEFSDKDGVLETLCRRGRKFNLQVVVVTQFPLALANRRILGALNGGWILLFLDGSQWGSISQAYRGLERPGWVDTYCAPDSHRAVLYDHRAWLPLDGPPTEGSADGRTDVGGATGDPKIPAKPRGGGAVDGGRKAPAPGDRDRPGRQKVPEGVESGGAAGRPAETGRDV
jgi:hypothetical protein